MNFKPHNFRAAFIALLSGVFAALNSFATTVTFTMTNSATGNPDTNFILIIPKVASANADGSYNTRALPFRIFPNTNGFVSTNLGAGNYLATNRFITSDLSAVGGIGGSQGVMFAVPSGTNTYPFGILAISGYGTFNYTPGVRSITGTNGVEVTSSSSYGDVIISATNFTPDFGYKVAAGTNAIIVTNGSVATVHAIVSPASVVAVTNGFTDIVRSNASIFYGNSNPSNYVTSAVTNTLAGTNYVHGVTNGLVGASVTNGLAGTNYVNTATNGFVKASVTNGLASSTQVFNATNALGTAAHQPRTAFQPSSTTLSNLAVSGALTFQIEPGANITFATNANTITIAGQAGSGGDGASVAVGQRVTMVTNGSVVTVTAVSQTNNFTFMVYSNVTDYPTLAIATNIARSATNGLGTAAFSAVTAFQPPSANLTNWTQVATGTVATLLSATNIANQSSLNATNALGTAAWSAVTALQPSAANLTNWSNVATGAIATLINTTNIATTIANTAALNATNGFSSIVTSNATLFVGTNDSRAVKWTNTASLYAGKLTNGVNLGSSFSSPGIGLRSLQIGSNSTASATDSTAYGDGAAAAGIKSSSFGSAANANGEGTTVFGANSEGDGEHVTIIGSDGTSTADRTTIAGYGGQTTANDSTSIGGALVAFTNAVGIGRGANPTAPNQIMMGSTTQYVVFPGNGTIAGTFTNSQTVLSNLLVDRDLIIQGTTNNVWVSGAGTPRANGTYLYGSAGVYTNAADPTFTLNFQNPTWFISSNAVNFYSATSPSGTSWSVVSGASSAPTTGYGADLDMRGENLLYYVNSTNLEQRISARQIGNANLTNFSGLSTNQFVYTNSLPGFQPSSAILTNLSNTIPNTNRYIGSDNITLTTNSGGIVSLTAVLPYVVTSISNQWRVDATNAVNLASNVLHASIALSSNVLQTASTNFLNTVNGTGGAVDGGALTNVNALTLAGSAATHFAKSTNGISASGTNGVITLKRANGTFTNFFAVSDSERGTALRNAFAAHVEGDLILVGPGTFDIGSVENNLTLKSNCTMRAAGKHVTKIAGAFENENILHLTGNNYLYDLSVTNYFEVGFGAICVASVNTAGEFYLENVSAHGDNDCFQFNGLKAGSRVTMINCDAIEGGGDAFTIFGSGANVTAYLKGCSFAVPAGGGACINLGPTGLLTATNAVLVAEHCTITRGSAAPAAVILAGTNVNSITLRDCKIVSTGTNILHQGTGAVYVDATTEYNSTNCIGTITRLPVFGTAYVFPTDLAMNAANYSTADNVGTSYAALTDDGTPFPITIPSAGTWRISGTVVFLANEVTATTQGINIKLRRTNNTAADLAGANGLVDIFRRLQETTTTTYGFQLSTVTVQYTTTNSNDSIVIQAMLDGALGAGNISPQSTDLVAQRIK